MMDNELHSKQAEIFLWYLVSLLKAYLSRVKIVEQYLYYIISVSS